jgi:hypothetical protein
MIGKSELENRFTYHKPDDAKKVLHERIRGGCLALAELIDQGCPSGREQSLAMTNVEQAMFWANARSSVQS